MVYVIIGMLCVSEGDEGMSFVCIWRPLEMTTKDTCRIIYIFQRSHKQALSIAMWTAKKKKKKKIRNGFWYLRMDRHICERACVFILFFSYIFIFANFCCWYFSPYYVCHPLYFTHSHSHSPCFLIFFFLFFLDGFLCVAYCPVLLPLLLWKI